MQLFAHASGHDWFSFILGALAAIACIFAIRRYNKGKDN